MTYLLPLNGQLVDQILPLDAMYISSQQNFNQTAGSPILSAQIGSSLVLRYQENGHITIPDEPPGKPSPGTVSIYGTACSSPQDKLQSIHGIWNMEGTGGDSWGQLLSRQLFDDGWCYQVNNGSVS